MLLAQSRSGSRRAGSCGLPCQEPAAGSMWPLIVPVHRLAPFPGRQDNRKGLGSKEGRMFKDTSPAPPEPMVRVSPAAARIGTMAG